MLPATTTPPIYDLRTYWLLTTLCIVWLPWTPRGYTLALAGCTYLPVTVAAVRYIPPLRLLCGVPCWPCHSRTRDMAPLPVARGVPTPPPHPGRGLNPPPTPPALPDRLCLTAFFTCWIDCYWVITASPLPDVRSDVWFNATPTPPLRQLPCAAYPHPPLPHACHYPAATYRCCW